VKYDQKKGLRDSGVTRLGRKTVQLQGSTSHKGDLQATYYVTQFT